MSHLQQEIKQKKPFESLAQEVVLNVMRTAATFRKAVAETLKPFELTAPQYNILRILRGAPEDGLPCSEVSARLVSQDPDVTRLLDRLEKRGLVTRGRSLEDRRVVNARITTAGVNLADQLDGPINMVHETQLGHMKKKRLRELIELLEKARGDEVEDE